MEKFVILVSIFILIPRLSNGVQLEDVQVRQFRNQLFYIEEKLNNEAKIRRESVQAILDSLHEIKEVIVKMNGSMRHYSPKNEEESRETKPDDRGLDSIVHALAKAFRTEKRQNMRMRRNVETLVETRILKIESNLETQIQTNEKRILRHFGEVESTLSDIKLSNIDIKTDVKDSRVDIQRGLEQIKTTLSNIEQSNVDIHDFQNSSHFMLQRHLIDIETKVSDINQSNQDLLTTVENLPVIKNDSTVCEREILNHINDKDSHNEGLNKTGAKRESLDGDSQGTKFESCVMLRRNGFTTSGLYDIYPDNTATPLRVYCDQITDGGGWIVFQRREDGSENFYRKWINYEVGFGNLEGEFWLGNENLHLLTKTCCHELRIDMETFGSERVYAKYSNFSIGSSSTNYVLKIGKYTGNSRDSLEYHNNMAFSTYDRDNDGSGNNCANRNEEAWWYNNCYLSSLNGRYKQGANLGIYWYWKGSSHHLKWTEMKLR